MPNPGFWKAIALVFLAAVLFGGGSARPAGARIQTRSLCDKGEKIVFSCELKRPVKIVSLCSSPELTRDRGYLQYRFGLPGKIELAFPERRDHSQQSFQYKHYFRYQVDMTQISFTLVSFTYSVFDDYNGEEKPARSQQGVTVTPSSGKDVTMVCRGRATANFADLADALPNEDPD
jgi:hypothetical protein